MSVRSRVLFFASLTLVAGELVLPGRAATAEATAPDFAPVQVHYEPHPATHGARSWLPDRAGDRVTDPPVAAARPTSPPLSPLAGPAPEPVRSGSSTEPLLRLPPARAPPALS